MQTLADLAKRLGSEDAARMALGNLNNLIALRSKDRPTQDFIVETFGKTAIHTVRVGLNNASDACRARAIGFCPLGRFPLFSAIASLVCVGFSQVPDYTLLLRCGSAKQSFG